MLLQKTIKSLIYISLAGALLLGYSYFEARWIKIKKIEITSPDLPASFDGKQLVFISDVHHGPIFSIERVHRLVDRINQLEPDIILLGGDYVYGDPKFIQPVFDAFGKFRSKLGLYAVSGNHEFRQGIALTREMIHKNHIFDCDNQAYWVTLGMDSIRIGGVSDLTKSKPKIDSTLVGLKPNDFCILLSHNPDFIPRIKTDKIDLTLSGHTHGGQITLLGIRSFYSNSRYGETYRYGLKKTEKMQSYITSGVGTIILPMRFFCRPEIVLITLKNQ